MLNESYHGTFLKNSEYTFTLNGFNFSPNHTIEPLPDGYTLTDKQWLSTTQMQFTIQTPDTQSDVETITLSNHLSQDPSDLKEITFQTINLEVGAPFEGGIIFYLTNDYCLIAAEDDIGYPNDVVSPTNICTDLYASSDAIGSGSQNTDNFFAVCDASTTYSVAYHFSKYNSPETGDNGFNTNGYNNGTSFTDWYLPSINELLEMHDVLENTDYAFDHQNQSEKYWLSSTAVNENSIKVIHLPTLQSNSSYIDEPYWRDSPAGDLRIRPIRTHTFD